MNMNGGKLFDKGTYSCIFTPPLQCKDAPEVKEDPNHTPEVSKLLYKSDAKDEWQIMKKIRNIPLWQNYFIISDNPPCIPASVQKDKDFDKCSLFLENTDYKPLSDFRIIQIPFGGTPLTIYKIKVTEFNFMEFALHLIEAGALLNLFGVVHRDIHGGNILMDDNQVPRIIDYNLSISVTNNISVNDLKHQHNINLPQEPPDSTLVNAIYLKYNHDKIIESIIRKKDILKKIRMLFAISEAEQEESLESYYLQSKSLKMGDEVMWFNNYWSKIDSWAIGVILVDLIIKLSYWSQFAGKLKKISVKLFPVLRKMCEVNPKERYDCVQALHTLSPDNFIIRKYGHKWINVVSAKL